MEKAESVLTKALQICQRCGFRLYEIDAEIVLAKLHLAKGKIEKAKTLAQSTQSKAKEMHYHLPKFGHHKILQKT